MELVIEHRLLGVGIKASGNHTSLLDHWVASLKSIAIHVTFYQGDYHDEVTCAPVVNGVSGSKCSASI